MLIITRIFNHHHITININIIYNYTYIRTCVYRLVRLAQHGQGSDVLCLGRLKHAIVGWFVCVVIVRCCCFVIVVVYLVEIIHIYIYIYIYIYNVIWHTITQYYRGGTIRCTLLDVCESSLRMGHTNILCILPMLMDDPRRDSSRLKYNIISYCIMSHSVTIYEVLYYIITLIIH